MMTYEIVINWPGVLRDILLWAVLVFIGCRSSRQARQIAHLKTRLSITRANMRWIEDQLIDHVFDHADDESEQIAKDYEI